MQFRLGIRPKPRMCSLQRSLTAPSWILEILLLRGGDKREGKEGETKGKGRREEGRRVLPANSHIWLRNATAAKERLVCHTGHIVPLQALLVGYH